MQLFVSAKSSRFLPGVVVGKMGLIMDDSEKNVSYMSLSRACGFTLSKNFLLVYRIIILFRQFLYEATKLFSMRFKGFKSSIGDMDAI